MKYGLLALLLMGCITQRNDPPATVYKNYNATTVSPGDTIQETIPWPDSTYVENCVDDTTIGTKWIYRDGQPSRIDRRLYTDFRCDSDGSTLKEMLPVGFKLQVSSPPARPGDLEWDTKGRTKRWRWVNASRRRTGQEFPFPSDAFTDAWEVCCEGYRGSTVHWTETGWRDVR